MLDLNEHPTELNVVVCRPALPLDTAGVMQLTREIWDGHDYVPYVWAEWLADPLGLLVVAEYAGRVVGLIKLSCKGAGEWWMQGLRVHPEFQGKGIASRLHDYVIDHWQRHLGGLVRLTTSSARLPVHHLCQRTGFRKVGEYKSFVGMALGEKPKSVLPVTEGEIFSALEYILKSPLHVLAFGFMDLGWYWGEPTEERLQAAVQRGHAFWRLDDQGQRQALLLFDLDDDEEGDYLYIQIVACHVEDITDTLVEYRRLAGALGYQRCAWMAPDQAHILGALEVAGFRSDWENSLYLFEKRLPG
jgi:GNAT superfamily N-acetyltransferase